MLPLIGAALGVVSTISGLGAQRSQANAQRDALQAQADEIATQKTLTDISIRNQEKLSAVQLLYDRLGLQAQKTLGLIQNDVQSNQAALERTSQRMSLEREEASLRQEYAQRTANTLLESTAAFEQLAAQGDQLSQQSLEARARSEQGQARDRGAVAAGGDTTQLMADLLQQGDVSQAIALIQDKGTRDVITQRAYELGILDLGREAGLANVAGQQEQVDLASQLDAQAANATTNDINAQYFRNTLGLEGAYQAETLGLLQAQTSSDVTNTVQQRSLNAQNKSIQGPGFWGTVSALGNAGLTAYQGYNAYRAAQPPKAPTPPTGGGAGYAAAGLVPSLGSVMPVPSSGYQVSGQEGYAALGLIPR